MKRYLRFVAESGTSGDMTAAALVDLGADASLVKKALGKIDQFKDFFDILVTRVEKAGISGVDFDVILDENHENHDHDMAYLFGNLKDTHIEHDPHDHHDRRKLSDILRIIELADMSENAKAISKKIFTYIADAEAKAHGMTREIVHFHEVGAVDSIVDVVSAAVLFDSLAIDDVIVKKLNEGKGQIRCEHGILDIPVPAVKNISEASGVPLEIMDRKGEFVTPTGIAIAAALRTMDALPRELEGLEPVRCGIGFGKRDYGKPSYLKIELYEKD